MLGHARFPRHERITRSSDFVDVYSTGKKMVGREFVFYVARRPGQGRKVGFTVSRKIGNAVARNKVKRYLREVYRNSRTELIDDVYLIIVARPACKSLDYHQCQTAIQRLFREGDALDG